MSIKCRPKIGRTAWALVFMIYDSMIAGIHIQRGAWEHATLFLIFCTIMLLFLVSGLMDAYILITPGRIEMGDGMKSITCDEEEA